MSRMNSVFLIFETFFLGQKICYRRIPVFQHSQQFCLVEALSRKQPPRPVSEISVRRVTFLEIAYLYYSQNKCSWIIGICLIAKKVLLENRYLFGKHMPRVPGKIVSVWQTDKPSWKIGICSVNTWSFLEKSRKKLSWKNGTDIFENSLRRSHSRVLKLKHVYIHTVMHEILTVSSLSYRFSIIACIAKLKTFFEKISLGFPFYRMHNS